MRILQVVRSLDPADGGLVEGVLRSVEAIQRNGHEVEVACLDPAAATWLRDWPARVHALGPRTAVYGYSRQLTPWLRRHRGDYDAVVLNGIWNYSSVGAWRALADGPTPYLIYPHGMLDPWFRKAYPLKHLAKLAFWLAFEGRVLRDAAAVLFTAEEERRLARKSFWGYQYSERVVGYGTVEPAGDPSTQADAFRAALPAIGTRRFLLFLGRIHPKKGCDLLIQAFAAVAARHPDLDLVMAGPDETGWLSELRSQATSLGVSGRVHWPGMLTGAAKWGAFRSAECFVLPSHQENFGLVVAEAMACGTPVLITDKVNIWREVKASGGGLVSKDEGTSVTATLADFLALSPQDAIEMRRNARLGFLHHFEISAAVRNLLDEVESARSSSAGLRLH